ncbi:glucokinase [Flagellimonas sp. CMM7]|uniref:glucokinase n=1 Tax=Flagellimonas sp. CMM7 TaxID=2654676 RepID=UPI0013D2F3DC|nr:glucokinase [Flagellimonas sp. CMM7]UII80303.1 glucokinase [Flagellimonas sp. CMM7]
MKAKDLILAADVGGTKTLMCLFNMIDGNPHTIKTNRYVSCDFDSLETIVKDFLGDFESVPKAAAFGIPGPVEDGMVKSTNLPWVIQKKNLSVKTGIEHIRLANDLAATAYSIPNLNPDEIINIKEGKLVNSPERYVVLAPGTGLGQSFLVCSEGRKTVIPSEGGHADFAPTSKMESELFGFLLQKFGHVSYERVISGIGLPNIFDFLVSIKKETPEKMTLERMKNEKRAVVITKMALEKKDMVCEKALDIFVSILGTHAGNLALAFLPDGGIYLAGGIPFKILSKIQGKGFMDSFLRKGRMREVVEHTPINLVTNNQAAMKGAALMAYELSQQ